jgi:hypothetical protein
VLGGAAGSILLSVKSGSALAGGTCVSPSSFSSIRANPATSHRPGTFPYACNSHGYWKNHIDNVSALRNATVGSAGFGGTPFEPVVLMKGNDKRFTIYDRTKLKELLWADGYGEGQLAQDLCAAYCDAFVNQGNVNFPFRTSDVVAMWNVVFSGGTYYPDNSNTSWNKEDVRIFLDVLVGNSHSII